MDWLIFPEFDRTLWTRLLETDFVSRGTFWTETFDRKYFRTPDVIRALNESIPVGVLKTDFYVSRKTFSRNNFVESSHTKKNPHEGVSYCFLVDLLRPNFCLSRVTI